MSALVLGRYDAEAVTRLLDTEGVAERVRARGYSDLRVAIDGAETGLTHVRLSGAKNGARHALFDACLTETTVAPERFASVRYTIERPIDLLLVYWFREEDPTRSFSPERPRLPLQEHPGLGVLRNAFLVALHMARELGKDGVGSLPKYFHDALIFHRSRLLLFLDGAEQGRFEALVRDLSSLSIREATLALVGGCVRSADGAVCQWSPGFLVMPLSPLFAAYFNSVEYTSAAAAAYECVRYTVDLGALAAVRSALDARRDAVAP